MQQRNAIWYYSNNVKMIIQLKKTLANALEYSVSRYQLKDNRQNSFILSLFADFYSCNSANIIIYKKILDNDTSIFVLFNQETGRETSFYLLLAPPLAV